MKKLTIFFVLSLLMCLAMAFPASALTEIVEKSVGSSYNFTIAEVERRISETKSKLPAGYNYTFITFKDYGSYATWIVYYSTTPVINSTSAVYAQNSTNIPATATKWVWGYNLSSGLPLAEALSSSPTSWRGWNNGYLINYSTALPSNIASIKSSALSAGYDIEYKLVGSVTTTALQALINTAKSKTNIGYTSTSWQALQSALTAAENLLKTTGYTQAQVDFAKNTLQSALDGLVLLPDISALQALINAAKSESSEGYTSDSWELLQSAITSAESLINTQNYTQAQIDSAKNTLQAALDSLVLLPDISELQELLIEADAIGDIGYTVPTWTRFYNARIAGHSLLARPSYTLPEVTYTTTELRVSMDSLAFLPNLSELLSLLDSIGSKVSSEYTSASWEFMQAVAAAARDLISVLDATQTDIDSMKNALQSAINGLVPVSKNIPPVSPDINIPIGGFPLSDSAEKYKDIKDGITPEHLIPARDAIFENIEVSRRYGLWVYYITLLPVAGIMIFINFVSSGTDYTTIDSNPMLHGRQLNGHNQKYLK